MTSEDRGERKTLGQSIRHFLLGVLVPLVIVAGGIYIAVLLVRTAPAPKRSPRGEQSALVKVIPAKATSSAVTVEATGTIVASRRISLKPQVSGRIVSIADALEPGGVLPSGAVAVQIEAVDYEIALVRQQGNLSSAERDYKVELGRQEIAAHEWEMIDNPELSSELEKELGLRKPYLAQAKAALSAAAAGARQAEIDLKRTSVEVPFNAVVMDRHVNIGSLVSPQTVLAEITDADMYWAELSVPVSALRWIAFPGTNGVEGSDTVIFPSGGNEESAHWNGKVIRLRPELEPKGRMARVIVSVDGPGIHGAGGFPLLLGSYVKAAIQGEKLESVYKVPRAAVRDGNRVWLMDGEGRLEVRTVSVLWPERDHLLVDSGLSDGDRLIVSDVPNAVPGMLLAEEGEDPREGREDFGKPVKEGAGRERK
ncbi:MAG: efflux RND transporter periplasmic adaptor subunit [Kiritimatiellia bacterium]|jgi:RND family efflux transporter MFP subunit|nr:efflux RND transporter periplasmic adaptor subunit [Kiritimatiellia bacterium]